jgi:hypothetical protein
MGYSYIAIIGTATISGYAWNLQTPSVPLRVWPPTCSNREYIALPGPVRYVPRAGPVAQLDRALPSEGRGREFESRRVRHFIAWFEDLARAHFVLSMLGSAAGALRKQSDACCSVANTTTSQLAHLHRRPLCWRASHRNAAGARLDTRRPTRRPHQGCGCLSGIYEPEAVLRISVNADVRLSFSFTTGVDGNIESRKLRPLAITTDRRAQAIPAVPTFAEVGLREVKIDVWFGLAGPAGLPAGIVRTINSAVNDALSEGELRHPLLKLGSDARAHTLEHFAEFWESEVKRYADVVRLSGATPE